MSSTRDMATKVRPRTDFQFPPLFICQFIGFLQNSFVISICNENIDIVYITARLIQSVKYRKTLNYFLFFTSAKSIIHIFDNLARLHSLPMGKQQEMRFCCLKGRKWY